MKGIVFKIQPFAVHDGPGIRTTVFLKGCPLRCVWCHNPEGMACRPQSMRAPAGSTAGAETVGRAMAVAELMGEIEKDRIFYDESGGGVTVSGGEPLYQEEFLVALLRACRRGGLHTAVDTSGYAPRTAMERVAPLADLFLFDLKILDDAAHRRFTGVSNRTVLENLLLLDRLGRPLRIRVPVVPGITDGADNLSGIADRVRPLRSMEGVDLLPHHRTGEGKYERLGMALPARRPPQDRTADMNAAAAVFAARGLAVAIGG